MGCQQLQGCDRSVSGAGFRGESTRGQGSRHKQGLASVLQPLLSLLPLAGTVPCDYSGEGSTDMKGGAGYPVGLQGVAGS